MREKTRLCSVHTLSLHIYVLSSLPDTIIIYKVLKDSPRSFSTMVKNMVLLPPLGEAVFGEPNMLTGNLLVYVLDFSRQISERNS